MKDKLIDLIGPRPATFGRRKVTPRACVAEGKKHLRAFLGDILEDLGFVTIECGRVEDLDGVLETHLPDLVLLGIAVDGIEPGRVLQTLVRAQFGGKVLAVGARESIVLKAVQQVGQEYALDMLPPLTTPFDAETLRSRIAMLLPDEPAPSPSVDVGEALHAGWLELWYQPKINARTLVRCGAEALVRMRHPTWGIVPAAHFIPEERDPHFRALSEFVVERALTDWHYLVERQSAIDLSINLPAVYLTEPQAVRELCRRMPTHPAFHGLTIEIESDEAIGELGRLSDVARDARLHNIGLAIDNVGTNWPSIAGMDRFPFTKLKADREFVTGCGDDRLKRIVCRNIVELARAYGVPAHAAGIESRADLIVANELGFDLVQGYLFGKPMPLKKFARSSLARTVMGGEPGRHPA
jgi:EAL domain-containing protein (putative c-di-GMP-specific phosphodiesterase class I)/CheY-like chemotaxis protein